jgi:hypothetical protein
MLRQCTIPPLIECPDKAEMYRDSAGHHPHLIPPLHLANSFGALSPNYPTEQLNLKHGRMAYPAKRDSFTKLSSRTTHFKISQDNISCEAGALSTNYPTEQRIVKYRSMACPAERGSVQVAQRTLVFNFPKLIHGIRLFLYWMILSR